MSIAYNAFVLHVSRSVETLELTITIPNSHLTKDNINLLQSKLETASPHVVCC